MSIQSYKDLDVWQKAMDFVVDCYKATQAFPKEENYGLTSQLQRAAVSVPANIAEGRELQSSKQFLKHIAIAYASLAEAETHILIAHRLKYIDKELVEQLSNKITEIGKMLNGLRKSIEKRE